jgi:GT2 family glycosyltransferase
MKPLITALVDTYNHEEYIEQALVSVLEQGLPPAELEIVVVDDGSTDGTARVIEKFVPRVKHLRKKNGGQASAFNAGFAESRGEIVALLDGDDWWAKGKLEAVANAFGGNPEVAAVSHGYYRFDEKTKRTAVCGPAKGLRLSLGTPQGAGEALRGWAFLQPSALSVRRKVLEAVVPIPEVLVFSADTAITVAAMAMGALVLPQPLSYYRFHGSNLWAVDAGDEERLRRKSEIREQMYEVLYPLLSRLGV